MTWRALAAAPADQAAINTRVEALTRLENVNLEEKPAIKAAVLRVLEQTRGTPNFVKLVQHFKLTNQEPGLIEVAIKNSNDEAGVTAIRLALAGRMDAVREALRAANVTNAVRLVEVLGNAKERQTTALLEPIVIEEPVADARQTEPGRMPGARSVEARRAAVRALAQTQEGAARLLALARDEKLPDNLKFTAASALHGSRWPEIKSEAAKVLPLPAGQNAQPLPPVAELVKMPGDAANGAKVYRRETVGCIKCHQVRGEGTEVGPALTEIGSKLTKEAMLEAILDPSAGISFGFEAWQVQLKSGDEAYGLKTSDTPEEIAIKDVNGIVTRFKKSEVASMQQSKTSIMPSGLQQAMTTQELVDLIEYLATLKKAE